MFFKKKKELAPEMAWSFVELNPSGLKSQDRSSHRGDADSDVIVRIDGLQHLGGDRELLLELRITAGQGAPVGQGEAKALNAHDSSSPSSGAASPAGNTVEGAAGDASPGLRGGASPEAGDER